MRSLSPALIALVCLANGQSGTQRIQDTLVLLRGSATAWIKLDGTECAGGIATPIGTDIYFVSQVGGVQEKLVLESLDYYGGLRQRIVGDGISLWAYEPQRNQYSASRYGAYNGNPPADYRTNLLSSFELNLKGTAAYAGRLLREVYGPGGARYRDWLPPSPDWGAGGSSWPKVFENGQVYVEPILGKTYRSGTTAQGDYVYVVYQAAGQKSLVFELFKSTGQTLYRLNIIYIAEKNRVSNRDRVIDAKLVFYPDMVPGSASFVFQPPAGSRAVASPKPVGG